MPTDSLQKLYLKSYICDFLSQKPQTLVKTR